MVVLPVLLATVAQIIGAKRRASIAWALAASGAVLASIKLSPAIANTVVLVLESVTGVSQVIVPDPTDLLGLAGLVVAHRILVRPISFSIQTFRSGAIYVVRTVALLACVATSSEYDSGWDRLEVVSDDEVVAWSSESSRTPLISTDGGQTWTRDQRREEPIGSERYASPVELVWLRLTAVCVRAEVDAEHHFEISESTDGGLTWRRVRSEALDAFWIEEQYGYEASIAPGDMVALGDDTVLIAAKFIEPLRRDPTSQIWAPTPGDLREFPRVIASSVFLVALCVAGTARRLRPRTISAVLWAAATVVIGVGCQFVIIDSVGPGTTLGGAMVIASGIGITVLRASETQVSKVTTLQQIAVISAIFVAAAVTIMPLALFSLGIITWQAATLSCAALVLIVPSATGFLGPRVTTTSAARSLSQQSIGPLPHGPYDPPPPVPIGLHADTKTSAPKAVDPMCGAPSSVGLLTPRAGSVIGLKDSRSDSSTVVMLMGTILLLLGVALLGPPMAMLVGNRATSPDR